MLDEAIQAVADFHEQLQIMGRCDLAKMERSEALDEVVSWAEPVSQALLKLADEIDDPRLMRAHLILEEGVVELFDAMSRGDEVGVLDALADLVYVTLGSSITFDLPLNRGFREVHASNMTKRRRAGYDGSDRVKDKGPGYREPDLETIVKNHRS